MISSAGSFMLHGGRRSWSIKPQYDDSDHRLNSSSRTYLSIATLSAFTYMVTPPRIRTRLLTLRPADADVLRRGVSPTSHTASSEFEDNRRVPYSYLKKQSTSARIPPMFGRMCVQKPPEVHRYAPRGILEAANLSGS